MKYILHNTLATQTPRHATTTANLPHTANTIPHQQHHTHITHQNQLAVRSIKICLWEKKGRCCVVGVSVVMSVMFVYVASKKYLRDKISTRPLFEIFILICRLRQQKQDIDKFLRAKPRKVRCVAVLVVAGAHKPCLQGHDKATNESTGETCMC